ncbi:MAG: TonB-dependent receptor plug domain-containing protein [Treponema sp.]|jgi:hypothetical protein|nr:TonB-dependent receptor plug domain-containing protein [Treponema sp.]
MFLYRAVYTAGIRLKRLTFPAVLSLTVFLSPVFARDVEILVIDADLGLALEGAVIHSWDGKEYACDGEGKARIGVPDGRDAVIRVSYPGYENGRLVIPPAGDGFTVSLRLSGVMENRELVVEAEKPGESETKSGRSVAISEDALKRTAEIGIVEDVMTSIKLLPGVGFTGMFNAMPSIRGGDPGDLTAVLDGFYIENPYHWGGGTSIFDPKMVSSARLSHGVFSARYGHTISGLLEVTSRKPSPVETEFDLGLSTSAAAVNLSVPLFEKGGIMFMGKVTYWDPFVWAAKFFVEEVRYIDIPPFIRDAALSANYRFTADTELSLNGFFGSDGIGVYYDNPYSQDNIEGRADMRFYFDNFQTFLISALTWNPRPSMVLRVSAGAGFLKTALDGYMRTDVKIRYTDRFLAEHDTDFDDPADTKQDGLINGRDFYAIDIGINYDVAQTTFNGQGHIDFDWDLGGGFILALGMQELYTHWKQDQALTTPYISPYVPPRPHVYARIEYVDAFASVENRGLNSSAYALLEYTSPRQFFGAELGFRADHLYFTGKDFSIRTLPALNPRLNLDFALLKDKGILDSLGLTLGTGLFSSLMNQISGLDRRNGIDDYELKQNRSWTSIAGIKLDFTGGYSFNIEGYYKYVFDRGYSLSVVENLERKNVFNFDGDGRIWGFDLQFQKLESRRWDGWLSYSFTYARYRERARPDDDRGGSPGSAWYWPDFHRFHNLNLVFNIKPSGNFNITSRLGLASGTPLNETGAITSSILEMNGAIIEYYTRASAYSETKRSTWSIPLDVKFSWFFHKAVSKVQTELYFAVENLLSLVYTAQGNSSFNALTGEEEAGSQTASYEMPIPMVSFGCKWSY